MNRYSRQRFSFAVLALALFTASAQAATITWNFDDGTLQGWTNVSTSSVSGGPESFVADEGGNEGGEPSATSGDDIVRPDPWGSRDDAHDTLHLQSTAFTLDDSGDLSLDLFGGKGSASSPVSNISSLPAAASGSGFQGVALHRVSDGQVLLSGRKFSNAGTQTITFSANQLDPYVGQDVQLNLIDYYHGGWGWVAMDTVSAPGTLVIPEPASLSLLGLGGLMLISRRRRHT